MTDPRPAAALTPAGDPPHNLRRVFKNIGAFRGQRAATSTPEERELPELPAELLETAPAQVVAAPLPVAGFVDGVQASLCVAYRAHRPVFLVYVGAAALGPGAKPLGVRERLFFAASALDRDWVDSVREAVPVEELVEEAPADVERAGVQLVGAGREQLERQLVDDLLAQEVGTLVCDGSLVARPHSRELVGVVKSMRHRFLEDETVLYGLRPGWRSPLFRISAGTAGAKVDLYSCYLRLFDASAEAWNFGLVRLEAFHPELLDPLAARALAERQRGASGGDARWDRHLTSVRATEEFLRARRPGVFSLGR